MKRNFLKDIFAPKSEKNDESQKRQTKLKETLEDNHSKAQSNPLYIKLRQDLSLQIDAYLYALNKHSDKAIEAVTHEAENDVSISILRSQHNIITSIPIVSFGLRIDGIYIRGENYHAQLENSKEDVIEWLENTHLAKQTKSFQDTYKRYIQAHDQNISQTRRLLSKVLL